MNNRLFSIFKTFSIVALVSSISVSTASAMHMNNKKMDALLENQAYGQLYAELENYLFSNRQPAAADWLRRAAVEKMHVPCMYDLGRYFEKCSSYVAQPVQDFAEALTIMLVATIIAKSDVDVCANLTSAKDVAHATFNNLVHNYAHRFNPLIQATDPDLFKEDGDLSYKLIFAEAETFIAQHVVPLIERHELPNAAWVGHTDKGWGGWAYTWIAFRDVEPKLRNICGAEFNQARVKAIRMRSLEISKSILEQQNDWAEFFALKEDNFTDLSQSVLSSAAYNPSSVSPLQDANVHDSVSINNTTGTIEYNEEFVPMNQNNDFNTEQNYQDIHTIQDGAEIEPSFLFQNETFNGQSMDAEENAEYVEQL